MACCYFYSQKNSFSHTHTHPNTTTDSLAGCNVLSGRGRSEKLFRIRFYVEAYPHLFVDTDHLRFKAKEIRSRTLVAVAVYLGRAFDGLCQPV